MNERPDGRSAANPLGLAFGAIEGEAPVTLTVRERAVADGVVIRALDLALAEVASPLEIEGGVERLQHHSTRLKGLVLDIRLDLIARAINEALDGTLLDDLRLDVEGQHLVFEAGVWDGVRRADMSARLTIGNGPHRSLRGYVLSPSVVGHVEVVPRRLVGALMSAGRRALERLGPASQRSFRRVGASGFALDPIDTFLWAVMPVHGWKVPQHEDVPLLGMSVTAAGFVRIAVGDVREIDDSLRPDRQAQATTESTVTSALVREDGAGLSALGDDDFVGPRAEVVFRNLAANLDPEDIAVVSTVLGLGVALPSLHPEVADLADRLADAPTEIAGRAQLALASVAAAEGRFEDQRSRLTKAGRALRATTERRLAGLALRTAAEIAPSEERARLLEETIALRVDDVQALTGLVSVLPPLGRVPAAVRAARRLAHLSQSVSARVEAHLTAAELLRDDLHDLPQARREFERAVKLAPSHAGALEGLALTAAAEGAREESTQLLQALVERSEADGQMRRAADFTLRVGELWLSDAPERALEYYRRAADLVPDRLTPLASMATAARRLGRADIEAEVVGRAEHRWITAEVDEAAAVLVLRHAAARCSAAGGRSDEALEHLRAAHRVAPEDLETLEALGQLHADRGERLEHARLVGLQGNRAVADGRCDDAAALFRTQVDALSAEIEARATVRRAVMAALSACPGHRALLDVLVAASVNASDRLDALDRRMMLDDAPEERARLWVAKAEALESAERHADAARAYEEAVATGAAPSSALLALVRLYRAKDDPERLALALARVAAAADTSSARSDALTERAEMLARVGRDSDALAAVQTALEAPDAPPGALVLATKLAMRLGHLEQARRYAEERLARSSADGEDAGLAGAEPVDEPLSDELPPDERLTALLDRADVAEKQRDYDGVVASLTEARQLVPVASVEGRHIAARLAKALAGSQRLEALLDLERQRGRVASAPPGERAERMLDAARIAMRLGRDEQAGRDVDEALGLLGEGSADSLLFTAAFEIQERLAERRGDPVALAEVLGRRANIALDADDRVKIRLEQSEVLEAGGEAARAVQVLQEALHEQPDALALAERLGQVAQGAGLFDVAADAFARAAQLADSRGLSSVETHGRAAATFVAAGRPSEASAHDRAVMAATAPGARSAWLEAALTRLESEARKSDDPGLLVEVLGRRAASASPEQAAKLLLQRAEIETDRLGRSRDALGALRRARTLAPDGSEVAGAVDARLTDLLGALGQYAEQASLLADRADRADLGGLPREKAHLLLDAARVHAEKLNDSVMALSRLQAAVRADPTLARARTMRLGLLRASGDHEALAEALIEEAGLARDPALVAELLTEAADLLVPVARMTSAARDADAPADSGPDYDRPAVERALGLVRRASGAAPHLKAPLEAAAAYTQALGRPDDELAVLAELLERHSGSEDPVDKAHRGRIRLRRAMLFDQHAHDFSASTEELLNAYVDLRRLPFELTKAAVRGSSVFAARWLEREPVGDVLVAVLSKGLVLTRRLEAWDSHLRLIEALLHRTNDLGIMAELYTRAGDVFAEHRLEMSAAESAYRSALRIAPEHLRARQRLRQLLVSQERFSDLADALGLEALLDIKSERIEELSPDARRGLLAAVVEHLAPDPSAQAKARLALADLELTDPSTADKGVERLRSIASEGNGADEAIERLLAYFEKIEDHAGYCDALRLQALQLTGAERAEALTVVAESILARQQDSAAAERELLAALDADPSCRSARQKLTAQWLAEERFEDLAAVMGPAALTGPVHRLLTEQAGGREQAFRAAAAWVGAHSPAERSELWLEVTDALAAQASDDDPRLVELLTDQLGRTATPEERHGLHLALARRWLVQWETNEDGSDAAEQAETFFRAVLEAEPGHDEARGALSRLFEAQNRYTDIGRVLGPATLEDLRAQADAVGDATVGWRVTEALAQLSEGAQRAGLLIQLVDEALETPSALETPESARRIEALYRQALEADPGQERAREGLTALWAQAGRYQEIADVLGVDQLRGTVDMVERDGPPEALLPAVLTLVDRLREVPSAVVECTELWVKAAELHQDDDDLDASEYALRMALERQSTHPQARWMLRELLLSQGRLTELANVDPQLLDEAVEAAERGGDVDLQVRGARVLAEQQDGKGRADLLAKAGLLERMRGREEAAEADLLQALKADPEHTSARAELENLYWSSGRFASAARVLGPELFLSRAERELKEDPSQAARAVRGSLDGLPLEARAAAFELLGATPEPAVEPAADLARRRDDLTTALQLWESADDAAAAHRVRRRLIAVLSNDPDYDARLALVDDAIAGAPSAEVAASLMLEQAVILHAVGRTSRALVVARRVLTDEEAAKVDRDRAAQLLVENLGAEGGVRALALERLVAADHRGDPQQKSRWRQALATMKEAEGADAEVVVELLEAALPDVVDRSEALELRRRLLSLHDELGDWCAAEAHAAALAEAEGTPEQWVTLSELRLWLDDREGAKSALDRAIARSPSSGRAHESLVRLAEQEGATESVMDRLEAWAEADVEGTPSERAERLLHAARLAVEAEDAERAGHLAERAVSLLPRHDPAVESVLGEAVGLLAPLGLAEERVRLLSQGLGELPKGAGSHLRLALAELLRGLDRADEAATVIEEGLHRELPEDDRLLVRFIDNLKSLGPDLAARRMLAVAERLGGGPAARRLRIAGAELAEMGGDKEGALTAWSKVVREVSTPDDGARARAARVRLSRELDDAPGLLEALLEAADDADNDRDRAVRLVEAADLAERRLEEPDRAEQLLRRAIQVADSPAALQEELLDFLRRHGRWMSLDAELARLAAMRDGADRAAVCAERAEILRSHLHDEVGAASLFVEAYEADPDPERGAVAASALAKSGDLVAAEHLLDAVLGRVPAGSHPWLRVSMAKAESLERAGRVDTAIETLRRVSEVVPGAALVTTRLKQLLVRHRRWDELAVVLLTDALHTTPIDQIRNRLAATRLLLKHAPANDRAVAALRSALRLVQGWFSDSQQAMPDDVVSAPVYGGPRSKETMLDSPLLDLAHLAKELGQARLRVEALRLHAQSLPAGTQQQRALVLLAAAEWASGDLDAAEFTLRGAVEALEAAPDAEFADRVEAYRALGMLLLDRDAAEEALEALQRAEAMLRGHGQAGESARAEVLVKLAQAYRSVDRPADAVKALEEARLLDPEEVPEGLLDEAVEAAGPSESLAERLQRRADSRTDPVERAELLREAARVWEQIGRSEKAIAPLQAAYECQPGQRDEAVRLQELLYQAERWTELADHIRHRLDSENLSETERVTLLVTQARLMHGMLRQPQEALQLFDEAFHRQPNSVDVLDALASQAAVIGRLDIQQAALARLAAASSDPQRGLRALIDRAAVLERMDDVAEALRVLEDAVERAFRQNEVPRALLDHLSRLYSSEEDFAAEARLWVRAAGASRDAQAAAHLARAAELRRDALADRRGALAAFEAAIRVQPDLLSLRWSAIHLAKSLGDEIKALAHARQAADQAFADGMTSARLAFLKTAARSAARLDDLATELEIWTEAIRSLNLDDAGLDELVDRTASAGGPSRRLPADALEQALGTTIEALAAGATRGRYRNARARVLENALGRFDDARQVRALAIAEDGIGSTNGHHRPTGSVATVGAATRHVGVRELEVDQVEPGLWAVAAGSTPEARAEAISALPNSPNGHAEPTPDAAWALTIDPEDIVQQIDVDSEPIASVGGDVPPSNPSVARSLPDTASFSASASGLWPAPTGPRPVRAAALVTAGQRRLEATPPDFGGARELFNQAIEACPDDVMAWTERARLDLREGDAQGAVDALGRLRDLGGPPWAPPTLELAIARIKMSRGDRAAAMAAFARAKLQDPTHREAAAGLAELAERLPSRRGPRRWFSDYKALLDPTLDAPALLQLHLAEARQARGVQDPGRALLAVARALRLAPDPEARQLRLDVLRDLGDSPFLLDALAAQAIEALEPEDAHDLQEQAFELARRLGDRRRGLVLAAALEARAGDDPDLLLSLYAFYREQDDRSGLLRIADRIGGIDALGPLPRDQRIALAAACFDASRAGEALAVLAEAVPEGWTPNQPRALLEPFIEDLTRALGVPSDLSEPADTVRMRAVMADLPASALIVPRVELALEALVAWLPQARATRWLLASAYQRNGVGGPKAVALYRSLLVEDPGDAALLHALAAVLPDQGGVGPRAVLHWIENEPALRHPWPSHRPADPAFFERLRTEAVRTPLGDLMRLTAPALAGVLPSVERPTGPRRSAHEDPRLADVAEAVRAVVHFPFIVVVDREGGASVELEPGDPSTLVVGEALAEDGTPDELRFHLARAAMLLELGFLVISGTQGIARRHFVTLAAAAIEPRFRESLPQTYRPGIDLLRARLDPTPRAAAEEAVRALSPGDLPISTWIRGAYQTADRFGVVMAGAPATALDALYRGEPRTLAEPLGAPEDRVRALRQWRPLRDLVAFVVSEHYAELLNDTLDQPRPARF